MVHHEAAATPFGHGGLGQEFVAEGGGNFETGANINDGNSDNSLRREERVKGQARGGKEPGCATIEPDHVVGEKHDPGGVAISPLHGDAAVMFEHAGPLLGGEKLRSEGRSGKSLMARRRDVKQFHEDLTR